MSSYCICTTEQRVKFYKFDQAVEQGYRLLEHLDKAEVSWFPTKESARNAAMQAGLKTWCYLRM